MPKGMGYGRKAMSGDPMPSKNTTSGDRRAFPQNVEPRGREYFGPAPRPERPVTGNSFNKDRYGKAKPWERSGR